MAHHRQIERFGHGRYLHPVRNAANTDQIDHDNIDRMGLDHVPKRRDTI